ncbi:MBL fold metallo-hydrolase [Hydrotalea flava]|uniref:MBL fold metallo-hydrolase n=1 Tax=Hydrotalea flava TaxID=714549 RepID=UPI00082E787D|nr:MBL fold metallo-hydrolase [Hydrotalea flava]
MLHIKVFTFNPIQENTYLIYNDALNAVIVDPGFYFSSEQQVFSGYIQKKQLTPSLLINTHCHLDHVFGNKWVHEHYKIELWAHKDEIPMLEMAPISGQQWGLPFENYSGNINLLQEGDKIYLDEDEFEIFEVPGHSPASICLYHAPQKILIAGDALFRESIGRTDLPGGNHHQLIKNIKEKLFVLPEDTVVYPGHGPATTIGHELRYNPFLQS